MAYCCNCGVEIPESDRTRLCDRCKKILLPFVKFMDASTSSGVKRLISNEQNLRNAGVTDSGMDYLLKVCELHDKKKMQERKEREAAKMTAESEPIQKEQHIDTNDNYSETELPMDEPLDFIRESYGGFLPAAQIILIIAGVAFVAWCVYEIILLKEFDVASLAGGIVSFASAYVANIAKKIAHDINEIKKRYR